MSALVLIAGAVLGMGCGILFWLAKRRQSMRLAIAAVMATFFMLSCGIFAVRMAAPELTLPAGVLAVLAFLATVEVAALGQRSNAE